MRYVSHERQGQDVFLTVKIRRWWAPWSWRRVTFVRTEMESHLLRKWINAETGKPEEGYDSRVKELDGFLACALAEERRLDALLSEEPEKPSLRLVGRRGA